MAVGAGGHLSVPLLGPLTFAADVLTFDNRLEQLFALELLYLAGVCAVVLLLICANTATPVEKLAWSLYALMALSYNNRIWVDDWSFMRVLSELHVLGVIILLAGRGVVLQSLALGGTIALWAVVAIRILRF
jgi:hypothetical protein